MTILSKVELIRLAASKKTDPKVKGALGQFFTPAPISLYMASLFNNLNGDIKILDPGCGPCSLSAAFVDECIKRNDTSSIHIDAYDIDETLTEDAQSSLKLCETTVSSFKIKFKANLHTIDFIENISSVTSDYSHVIMNPPYKKILSSSIHRKVLRKEGIETVNLYSGFVALAIQKLKENGELVAIIPRSFCNGTYYQPFREMLLKETAIKHIHIFDSRKTAFSGDSVLQENIIIHLIKNAQQEYVQITSSPTADFYLDEDEHIVTASAMTIRNVPFSSIVNPSDKYSFIHIAANNRDQQIIDKLSVFTSKLEDLKLQISTGPVVGFRTKNNLVENFEEGTAPILYPVHLKNTVKWPQNSSKPNAIKVNEETRKNLWRQNKSFVIVKRLSSKEEKRRIMATAFHSNLPGELIGFENKVNVFHCGKSGFNETTAIGLNAYLNSSLLDNYYRIFGGHTQVNATDLRAIPYPNLDTLQRLGQKIKDNDIPEEQIDYLLNKEINSMTGDSSNPLEAQNKINEAILIISALGLPKAQHNERSALTLLALLNLHPSMKWGQIESPLIGVTPIMDWVSETYGKQYAPNSRETFRRQTLHQFVDGGLCLYNPDKPDRAVNSPQACYQIAPELINVLQTYETENWNESLANWLKDKNTLAAQYAMNRKMKLIPLTLGDGTKIKLSPGIHSQLIRDIVMEFGPRFAPGSEVIYLGDTGAKEDFFKKDRLAELGVTVNRKGKLPDVVLYWAERDWLLLIESVTSHGPVDGKRHGELSKLFKNSKPGLVYVTAFPNRKIMGRYLVDLSWETEVWVSEAPSHMIHFNGDRFLGPHG